MRGWLFFPFVVTLLVPTSLAGSNSSVTDLPAWATPPPNLTAALVLAGAGFVGVAAAAFSKVGGVFDGTAGSASYRAALLELQKHMALRDDLIAGKPTPAGTTFADLEKMIEDERGYCERLQKRQFWGALAFFFIAGVGLSLLIATSILQALAIGLAGPAALTAYIAKKRSDIQNDAIDQALVQIGILSDAAAKNAQHAEKAKTVAHEHYAARPKDTAGRAEPRPPTSGVEDIHPVAVDFGQVRQIKALLRSTRFL